ncbi:hypothetical protein B0H17DRAFT_1130829 [Mycena rosella]|uniref:Bacteriophage T5 Orf172 DNA-binding domain-containing protein n=1 Tax=Mycena rosella TaxID=1033263 RepID=A0AAD7GN48_MYCRO|nr:hypothetical protein B0H17DRAFT_1130829 [Mycena rosella]
MSGGIQLLPDHIIDEPPSPSDKRGFLYEFVILDDDDDDVVKYGRSNNPLRRRREWARQCKGQDQHWQYCWEVPFAAKFEKLIHEHFKRAGAWLGPSPCSCCPVTHREKFDLEQCGEMKAVIRQGYCAVLTRHGEFWGLDWGEKEMEQENSVNADTATTGGIIATDVTGFIDENGPEVVDSGGDFTALRRAACDARRDARDSTERCACAARGRAERVPAREHQGRIQRGDGPHHGRLNFRNFGPTYVQFDTRVFELHLGGP